MGPKALVNLDGVTMIARVSSQISDAGFSRVVAVLPPGVACPIAGLASTVNGDPESGALGSVIAGLRVMERQGAITDLLVWPVDHPWVRASQLSELSIAAAGAEHEISRVVPVWRGRRGHPIWVRLPGIVRLQSVESVLDGTLRSQLVLAGPALEIPAEDETVLRNLNEPADL